MPKSESTGTFEPGTWNVRGLRTRILRWYDTNRRDLPWRRTTDPYAIWVSEIMLQQTRVAVVVDRYTAFMKRFPNVGAVARAGEQEVLALWSGLGYYRRARMLHQAAKMVATQLSGRLPQRSKELLELPGVGSYTAAAIASIAHQEPVAVVDGNVERVLCRLAGWDATGAGAKAAVRRNAETLALHLLDPRRPGDHNQAMMELGATVCLPRNPRCGECPLARMCKTRGEHKTSPRAQMQSREVSHALSLRTRRGVREVLLEQRPAAQSVMPGLWELPLLRETAVPDSELRMEARHAIMQVNYRVKIRSVDEHDEASLTLAGGERRWVPVGELPAIALTGLARKVLSRARLLVRSAAAIAIRL